MSLNLQGAWGKVVQFTQSLFEEKASIRGKHFQDSAGFHGVNWTFHEAVETEKDSGQFKLFRVTNSTIAPMSGRGLIVDCIPLKVPLDEDVTYSADEAKSRIDQLDVELTAKRAQLSPGALQKN